MISVFNGAYKTDEIGRLTVDQVVHEISHPMQETVKKVSRIREIVSGSPERYQDEKTKLKTSLRAYTIASTFKKKRGAKNFAHPSGLASVDIDGIKGMDAEDVRDQIFDFYPFVCFCFVTPSGIRVKPVIRIPVVSSPEEYKAYYTALMNEFNPGVKIDTVTSSIASLTFTSVDPGICHRPIDKTTVWNIRTEIVSPVISTPPINFNLDAITDERQFIRNMVVKQFRELPPPGSGVHTILQRLTYAVGGFVQSGYLSRDEAVFMFHALIESHPGMDQIEKRKKSTIDFIDNGMSRPLYLDLKK